MWIYAITRLVAEKNKYNWGFNPSPEFDYYGGKPQMDFMNINYGKIHTYKYDETPPFIEHIWKEQYITTIYKNDYGVDRVDYHPYQPDIFKIKDNTKLIIRCCQDYRYIENYLEDIQKWFKIKPENEKEYYETLRQLDLNIFENMCVLNVRGGEYKGIHNLILSKKYWGDAIREMEKRNPKMKFIIVTDDVEYCKNILDIPAFHFSVGMDYYIINNAANLILSNSSFALFPAILNKNVENIIAPKYWARHNVSTGYWASSQIDTFGFSFMDRNGNLS